MTWKKWTPKRLKEKQHDLLRSPHPKIRNKDTLNDKLESMITYREEVIKVGATFQEEEQKLKIELLNLEIQKQKLAIELLKELGKHIL